MPVPELLSVEEAARRLSLSAAQFEQMAAEEAMQLTGDDERCRVDWAEVERAVARCRVDRVDDTLHRSVDPERNLAGVALLDMVKARFDWSDIDVADALGVWPSTVSRYRITGVPAVRIEQLRELSVRAVSEVAAPRRVRWETRDRKRHHRQNVSE
ncbi:MAG: hypothetical protein ACREOV_09910 [Candidatus Dormibacteraceae bacterium]